MLNFVNQLLVPDWVATSFPIIRMVLMAIIVLSAISIIIFIMCLESNPEGGTNVISGSSDSFYSQNQSSTREGRLKRLIVIFSIILVVVAVVFFLSYIPFQG